MNERHAWTSNPVPHFGNQVEYVRREPEPEPEGVIGVVESDERRFRWWWQR